MNSAIPIVILLIIFIILYQQLNDKVIAKQIIKSTNKERVFDMLELAKEFIGKECIIYTFNSQLNGVIKEVSEGAMLIESGNIAEVVNLDFVVRIREYPKGKNGKKKAIIFD